MWLTLWRLVDNELILIALILWVWHAWTCRFCTNTIVTARYDSYSFIPVNLFQQFQRPANLYFLLISALQCRPELSTATWGTTLTPLLFVLILNGLKEGYDDWKRKSSDKKVAPFYKEKMQNSEFVFVSRQEKNGKIGTCIVSWTDACEKYKILIQRLDSVKKRITSLPIPKISL